MAKEIFRRGDLGPLPDRNQDFAEMSKARKRPTRTAWIEIKVALADTFSGYWAPGDVVEWEAADAERLIQAGYAKPAKAPADGKSITRGMGQGGY
jgi:hypothetical protein